MKIIVLYLIFIVCVKHIHSCSNINESTRISDLDLDCQMTILELLKLDDLSAMANVNRHFKIMAGNVFRRKFSDKIKFLSPYRLPRRNIDDALIRDGFIMIADFEIASKVLQSFNHFISSIVVELPQFHREDQDMLTVINKYCSETLTSYEFQAPLNYYYQSIHFDVLTKPFVNVLKLTVSGNFNSVRNLRYNLTFSELFPSVHHLYFYQFSTMDFGFVGNSFPNLLYFYADVIAKATPKAAHGYELKLEEFFRLNSQIRSLELKYSSSDLLRIVGRELQLENLTLNSHINNAMHEDGQDLSEIRLDNITRLTVRDGGLSMPHQAVFGNLVEFGNLKEFETDAKPIDCSKWIDFIEQRQSLSKITLNGRFIAEPEFSRIAEITRNLIEFNGRFYIDVTAETIIKFIQNNENLRKMHLEFSALAGEGKREFSKIANTLRTYFGDKTKINVNYDAFEICLEWY